MIIIPVKFIVTKNGQQVGSFTHKFMADLQAQSIKTLDPEAVVEVK